MAAIPPYPTAGDGAACAGRVSGIKGHPSCTGALPTQPRGLRVRRGRMGGHRSRPSHHPPPRGHGDAISGEVRCWARGIAAGTYPCDGE